MMPAQNQRHLMELAHNAGATHFLAKPLTAETLGPRIATTEVVAGGNAEQRADRTDGRCPGNA